MKRRRRKKSPDHYTKRNGNTHLIPTKFPLPQKDGFQWSNKRIEFCHQFMIDKDIKNAAIRAGYSAKSANSQGSTLMTYEPIQEYIALLGKDQLDKIDLTAQRILKELACIAFFSEKDMVGYDSDGNRYTKTIDQLTREEAAAIHGYQEKVIDNILKKVTYKVYPKLEALKMLGAHLGLSLDKKAIESTGTITHDHKSQPDYIAWRDILKHLEVEELDQFKNLISKAKTRSDNSDGRSNGFADREEPSTLH